MPKPTPVYSLYYVTGRSLLPPPPSSYTGPKEDYYLAHLEQALKGGVTVVQVREKDVDGGEFLEVARRTKEVCDKVSVKCCLLGEGRKGAEWLEEDGGGFLEEEEETGRFEVFVWAFHAC